MARKFEEYLAPWEVDSEGKPLDEPADVDPVKLKKYLFNLLGDKEELQAKVTTVETEREEVKEQLTTLQREHEDEDARRKREEAEREARYTRLEAEATERRKIELIEQEFEEQGITPSRARKLAARVKGDEKDWISDAQELVEDGFRLSDKPAGQQQGDEGEEGGDDGNDGDIPSIRPVRRSNGRPATAAINRGKAKSVAEELAEAIPIRSW